MTYQEAIKRIQDHIRIHRIGEYPHIKLGEALNMATAALREKAERENPEPLTLEELAQLVETPVWVQPPGEPGFGRWAIVEGVDTTNFRGSLVLRGDYTCHDYGRVWVAYRSEPKEAEEK